MSLHAHHNTLDDDDVNEVAQNINERLTEVIAETHPGTPVTINIERMVVHVNSCHGGGAKLTVNNTIKRNGDLGPKKRLWGLS